MPAFDPEIDLPDGGASYDDQVHDDVLDGQNDHGKADIVSSDWVWHEVCEEHEAVGKDYNRKVVVELESIQESVLTTNL